MIAIRVEGLTQRSQRKAIENAEKEEEAHR